MKRYDLVDFTCQGEPWREMREEPVDGDWVKYEEVSARIAALEAENERLRAELSCGIAYAFNIMEPRTLEDQRGTLDEQLSVLEESYKAREAALAAARDEMDILREQIAGHIAERAGLYEKLAHGCTYEDCGRLRGQREELRAALAEKTEECEQLRDEVANQAERIRTLEGATNHAGGLRDATPEVRTMDDLLWVPRCAESSEADAEYWGRMYAVEQERAERALAAFHRTEAALAAKTAECDLRGAQLLMIGSEISGDRKVNPADRGDPRWTPTLEQVAAIRAREADPGRVERAAEAIWSLCAPGRGNPMSWASVGAEYPTVADAFREKAKTVLAAADGEVLR